MAVPSMQLTNGTGTDDLSTVTVDLCNNNANTAAMVSSASDGGLGHITMLGSSGGLVSQLCNTATSTLVSNPSPHFQLASGQQFVLNTSSSGALQLMSVSPALYTTSTCTVTSSAPSTSFTRTAQPRKNTHLVASNELTRVVKNTQLFKALQPQEPNASFKVISGAPSPSDGSVIIGCQSFKPTSTGYGINKAQIVPVSTIVAQSSGQYGSVNVSSASSSSVPYSLASNQSVPLSSPGPPGMFQASPLASPNSATSALKSPAIHVQVSYANNSYSTSTNNIINNVSVSNSSTSRSPSYSGVSSALKPKRNSRSKKKKNLEDEPATAGTFMPLQPQLSGGCQSSKSNVVQRVQAHIKSAVQREILVPHLSPLVSPSKTGANTNTIIISNNSSIGNSPSVGANGFTVPAQHISPLDSSQVTFNSSPANLKSPQQRYLPPVIDIAMTTSNNTASSIHPSISSGSNSVTAGGASVLPTTPTTSMCNNTKQTVKQVYLSPSSQEVSR